MKKAEIIAAIKRTAATNGNVPVGARRFQSETGIGTSKWRGVFWATWSDALAEAGFTPLVPLARVERNVLLESLARLTHRLGRFPTTSQLLLEKRTDDSFPHLHTFEKHLGDSTRRLQALRDFVRAHAMYADVLALLPAPSCP